MANSQHLDLIKQGVDHWNEFWADQEADHPDLSDADLREVDMMFAELNQANLQGAFLSGVNLDSAQLMGANLRGALLDTASLVGANLDGADLSGALLSSAELGDADLTGACLSGARAAFAQLHGAILTEADLRGIDLLRANLFKADLRNADVSDSELSEVNLGEANLNEAILHRTRLCGADLRGAFLRNASLVGADLSAAVLIGTHLEKADITDCRVYGIAAWNVQLKQATQVDLIITPVDEPTVTVDNLEIAQFVYLLLNNEKFRTVIDTITSKVVLILGRFTENRKRVLDAVRRELRIRNYLPVMFDFEKPSNRDLTETISTLAHMARFVIADLTDPRSIPQELTRIVPQLPSVPIQPLLLASQSEYAMFESLRRYPWVLEPHVYEDEASLLADIVEKVIVPAELRARDLVAPQFARRPPST